MAGLLVLTQNFQNEDELPPRAQNLLGIFFSLRRPDPEPEPAGNNNPVGKGKRRRRCYFGDCEIWNRSAVSQDHKVSEDGCEGEDEDEDEEYEDWDEDSDDDSDEGDEEDSDEGDEEDNNTREEE